MSQYENIENNWGLGHWLGSAQLEEPDWSFYLLGVIKGEDGYYLSTDSGCSCPTPWDSHDRDSWTGPLTAEQAREEATSLWEYRSYEPEEFKQLLDTIV